MILPASPTTLTTSGPRGGLLSLWSTAGLLGPPVPPFCTTGASRCPDDSGDGDAIGQREDRRARPAPQSGPIGLTSDV